MDGSKESCTGASLCFANDATLVLLPGLDGTGRLFEPFINRLPASSKFRVISYPLKKRLSYEQLAEFVSGQINSSDRVVVVAESFSGPVATILASQNPDNLAAVVFCATFAVPPHQSLLALARFLPLAHAFSMALPEVLVRRFLLSTDAVAPAPELLKEVLASVEPEVIAYRLACIAEVNTVDLLGRIAVPCCYVRAVGDKLIGAESATPFVERISGLVIKEIEGPHLILQASPPSA